MARSTKDPEHTELTAVLDGMLQRDEEITARAVTRLHSSINNASDLTRHEGRRAILEKFQQKQVELRRFAGKVRNTGTAIAAKSLQVSDERVRELEENEQARIVSHIAMISAVAELGGTQKLQKFYKDYARIRDQLVRQGALPSGFIDNVTPLPKR